MAKKFIRPATVTMMVFAAIFLGVFVTFFVIDKKEKNKEIKYVSSLPVISTKEEILSAVSSPDKKTYVIESFDDFDKRETVSDPYSILEDEFIYIEVYSRTIETERIVGRDEYIDRPSEARETTRSKRGRLFLDGDTELDISYAEVLNFEQTEKKHYRKRYFYDYIKPDAKMSFIALLGNHEAGATKMGMGNSSIFKKKASSPMYIYGTKWISLTFFGILLLVIYGDYLQRKEEEAKREQRRRSKAGQRKNG